MRHSILNFTKWLFGILGISITGSCLNSQGPIICEYGTPHCEYEVKGKVIKDCSACTFPHEADNYDLIMKLLSGVEK